MSRPLSLVVLKTGAPVPKVHDVEGTFRDMFARIIQADAAFDNAEVAEIDLIDALENDALPTFSGVDGVIMSGSAAMLGEDAPWMRRAIRTVKDLSYSDTPFLGVCFGHQVLGRALDADVGANANGRKMGTVPVTLRPHDSQRADPFLQHLPRSFSAQVSHIDVIRDPGPHLEVVGDSTHDGCHVVRFRDSTWGVQFHPEFSEATVRAYVSARAQAMRQEGLDPGEALARAHDTDEARELMRSFVRMFVTR